MCLHRDEIDLQPGHAITRAVTAPAAALARGELTPLPVLNAGHELVSQFIDTPPPRYVGAARRALDLGVLPNARPSAELEQLEFLLREGIPDEASKVLIASKSSGDIFRYRVTDPSNPASSTLAVTKGVEAQAAQEDESWGVAKLMGIDHIVAAVQRRADGTAYVEFREGETFGDAGIMTVPALEAKLALAHSHRSPEDAAQLARIERQLLQVFDYIIANSDRHGGNGLWHALEGVSYIDGSLAGRGVELQGASTLKPSLRLFQAGDAGGTVVIDPEVVEFIRKRVTPDKLRALHAQVYQAPGIQTPAGGTSAARRHGRLSGATHREGTVARLQQVLTHGRYEHLPGQADPLSEGVPREERMREARGFSATRAARHMIDW